MDFGGQKGARMGVKMGSKRHQKINFFLVVFLEGSGSLGMVAGVPRKPHFRQRIPAAAPYSKITI